jgi:hypothetical protein
MGAPDLAFETWESTNLNTPHLPLSTAFLLHIDAEKPRIFNVTSIFESHFQ